MIRNTSATAASIPSSGASEGPAETQPFPLCNLNGLRQLHSGENEKACHTLVLNRLHVTLVYASSDFYTKALPRQTTKRSCLPANDHYSRRLRTSQ
jgi:hypothetical protein